jgi:hypothetical protein
MDRVERLTSTAASEILRKENHRESHKDGIDGDEGSTVWSVKALGTASRLCALLADGNPSEAEFEIWTLDSTLRTGALEYY